MSFFDTISRIIQQGKEMAVKATPASKQTYVKAKPPVNNSQFTSNPLLKTGAIKPAPVTFGVPTRPNVPAPLLPINANSTRQTVTPAPIRPPQIPQPPINPLDIIRNGKEAVLRMPQGNEATAKVRPNTIFNEALFGNEQDRAYQNKLANEGTNVGMIARAKSGGILGTIASSFARTTKERQDATSQALIDKGVDPNRAIQIAYQVDASRSFSPTQTKIEMEKSQSAKEALDTLKLTPQEKRVLATRKVIDAGETALDATTFGVGGVTKNVGKTLLKDAIKGKELDTVEKFIDFQRGINLTSDFDPVVLRQEATAIADKLGIKETGPKLADKFAEVLSEGQTKIPNRAGAMDVKKPNVLDEEAKKYKTADEFVAAQGTTLYHGTTPVSAKGIESSGFKFGKGKVGAEQPITNQLMGDVIYFADTPQATKGFTRTAFGEEPAIIEVAGSNLKLATPTDVQRVIKGDTAVAYRQAIEELKKEGFDGLKKGSNDIAVWNIDKVKTKSQLTDIYNKAHAKPAPVNKKLEAFKSGKPSSEGGYIRNPLAKAPEKSPANNQVVSSGNDNTKVYHGTNDTFDNFDKTKQKSGYYPGAYTTTDVASTKKFGSNLMEADIDAKKFYKIKDGGDGLKAEASKAGFETRTANGNGEVAYLKSKGYEGIQRGNEFIIFDPVNLKRQAQLSPIGRLIADNKIRVVSRDGRDVYQVKKGGEWVSKRDEDSAIRAVTPRSPIDVIKTPKTPKITRTEAQYRVTPEQIKDYDSKLTALSGAEAGERVVKNNPDGTFGGYVAKKSTFPSYIDEDLRSRKLFDRYMDGRQGTAEDFNITYPKGSKLDRIDKIIKGRIGVKEIKVRQMSRSRDVARLEQEATDRVIREQRRVERQTSPAFRSVLDEPTQLNKERVAQLEKAAMPTAEVVRPSTPYKVDSLANVITKTPLDRKVNIIDYLRTPDRVLNKIGFGKEAKLLREQYEKYSVELPKNIDKISEWVKRVPKDASERIFHHLDGKAVKLSATEQKVADEIRAYLKDWADRLGLPEENRVANYITRLFDDQLIKQEFDEDLAKIISGKIPGEVYNPFLQKRLGAKGYKQDVWGALDAYTKRATRKVHLDPALDRIREKAGSSLDFTQLEESQFKYIQRYIDRVQMRPTEIDNAIDNAVKQTLGYRFGQRPVTNVSRFLRRMTYRGMLGANLGSALRNLSQGVNTYAVLGEKYTAIGYAKLLQPASQRELIEQGIFNNNFIEDRVLSSTKKLLQKGDKALWFFFDKAEKINRGSAYLGAKAKGLGKGMSEQEAIDYAKNIVRKTQFSYDAVDQPVALGSDIMKTMFQFQTYTTKQTEFLTEMIKDKNVVGLLRYAIGGYLFVNTVGKALGMSESELIPLWDTITGERKFSPAPALKFPIEVVKAVADTPDKYGNERDLEQKAKDVGGSLIGLIPGGNQIKKTVEGMQANAKGGSFTKAGVKQFEVSQSPAAKLQTILFGKYANENAKNYFNKTSTTGNKELDRAKKEDQKATKARSEGADVIVASLVGKSPEQNAEYLKELYVSDKDMYERVIKKVEQKKLNWSVEDKAIADLGVKNGAKAEYVKSQLKKMKTPQEKSAYLTDLYTRKIISKDVLDQITGTNSDIIQ